MRVRMYELPPVIKPVCEVSITLTSDEAEHLKLALTHVVLPVPASALSQLLPNTRIWMPTWTRRVVNDLYYKLHDAQVAMPELP